jgi:hypothetical protein
MSQTLSTVAGVFAFAWYFILFSRSIRSLGPEDQKRYVEAGSKGILWLSALLLIGAAFISDHRARIGCALALLVVTLVQSVRHHRKLLAQGFPTEFLERQAAIAPLAGGALLLLLYGFVTDGL